MSAALETRSVDLGATALEYHVTADGPGEPLLLLHPWFGSWQFWGHVLEAMPERPCYAVDLYSIGKGDWLPFASPIGLADAVLRLLDAEGIERCVLAGNSTGGIAGQVLAAAVPDRISRLVLVGTGASTGGLPPAYRAELESWIAGHGGDDATAALVGRLLSRRPADDEFDVYVREVSGANRDFVATTLRSTLQLDLRPRLPRISAQTLVIRGDRDAARTPEHVAALLAGIPGSTAVEIPGGGHSPMVDSADLFIDVVRRFLGES